MNKYFFGQDFHAHVNAQISTEINTFITTDRPTWFVTEPSPV